MLSKIFFIIFFTFNLFAVENIFYDGKTYDFAEKNLIEEIQQYILSNKDKINKQLDKYKEKAKTSVDSYKPKNIKLTRATKTRVFYPDMSYTSEFDIKDQNGKILYPKGFKFNPMKFVHLPYEIVVIDATAPEQIKWLKKQKLLNNTKYKILLSDGNHQDISKELEQPVFYLTSKIIDRFKLEKTPSMVKQIGQRIEIKEIHVKDID